ncbi:phage antirepressor YoqD-like protein [Paraburkholderia sp. BL8N3]|nr:phage antirepressor YoqD-like protein [Paraburkholderia sp. BL8N3]
MNEIVKVGVTTMSSREIADLVEKRHDNVKRAIDALAARGAIGFPQTEEIPTATKPVLEYRVGKRDSYVIVAQLSPEFTARLVDRWQELEAVAASPAFALPKTMSEALRLAADLADENVALKSDLAVAGPKVEALDRIAVADGSMCITDAAKTLQTQPKQLFGWMSSNQWIYRRPGSAEWTAYQDKLQRGVLEHKVNTVHRGDGSEKITTRVLVTSKGLAALAQKMGRAA